MSTSPDDLKDQQQLLDRLNAYLRDHFSCKTAVLYGSRARGDWDTTSDIDVIAFGDGIQMGYIAHRWENLFLDLFLYPPGTKPKPDWLRIHDGRVLFQHGSEGDEVFAATKEMFSSGPERMSSGDAQTTRLWLEKMLARAEKGDIEGDYRRHWLLKDALEMYFLLTLPGHFQIMRQPEPFSAVRTSDVRHEVGEQTADDGAADGGQARLWWWPWSAGLHFPRPRPALSGEA